MTIDKFWRIIAASRAEFDPNEYETSRDQQLLRLSQLLSSLPVPEVQSFLDIFSDRMGEAYSPPRKGLWGVAFDIGGGCSNDCFDDFRSWLISMGREVYEAAIRNPESVFAVAEKEGLGEDIFFEEFQYVPSRVLRKFSGEI